MIENEMLNEIYVAKTIGINRIVINKGSNDGINSNMEFSVYMVEDEIFDPITKESLGNFEVFKGLFTVLNIQEKMTTLNRKQPINILEQVYKPEASYESIEAGDKVKIVNYTKSKIRSNKLF